MSRIRKGIWSCSAARRAFSGPKKRSNKGYSYDVDFLVFDQAGGQHAVQAAGKKSNRSGHDYSRTETRLQRQPMCMTL